MVAVSLKKIFFKQKTAYEITTRLVGSEMCIRDSHYLIMEDHFPNGRPKFEKAGVFLTDRATVDKADTMKVTTCLNPLHTSLAIMGCLLGYRSIAEEMKDPDLSLLVSEIGYNEGLPVVESPGIIDPKIFLEEVITVRFSNPNIPDMPCLLYTSDAADE